MNVKGIGKGRYVENPEVEQIMSEELLKFGIISGLVEEIMQEDKANRESFPDYVWGDKGFCFTTMHDVEEGEPERRGYIDSGYFS